MRKLGRREMPSGYSPTDFTYQGRPAKDQGDYDADDKVGIADGCCVNQFGEANNSKHYHGGVVQSSDGRWWCYFEWGRVKPGKSWNGSWTGNSGDFQFYECSDESEARDQFAKQYKKKNLARLEQKTISGIKVWAAKTDKNGKPKDGYLIQSLATREKGLPDALTIKDDEGKAAAKPKAKAKAKRTRKAKATKTYQPEVIRLARDLVGGVQTYTRALSEASGVTPTLSAITQVRDKLIPAAMGRIKVLGPNITMQSRDRDLQAVSKMVYGLVPRFIPRQGLTDEEAILSGGNILSLQQDLDAFEAALNNEDFSAQTTTTQVNPDTLLNAQFRWIDPKSDEAKWLARSFQGMSNNRHGYLGRGQAKILNLFAVTRPDRDAKFAAEVARVGAQRRGQFSLRANLQPRRTDLKAEGDAYAQANVIMAIHGTRSVNIAPIVGGNFRLPRSLPGAQITGANFGHGIYFATDFRKAYGYTGHGSSYWASGGQIKGRGFFMFLADMLMGDAYRAPTTGSWGRPPNGKDSVFGVGGDRGHRLQNDEHIIFSPDHQRIRYVVEGSL